MEDRTMPEMTKEEFRQLRLQLGLTQEQLAREIGVTLGAVQKWELGLRGISGPVARLVRLMAAQQGEKKAA